MNCGFSQASLAALGLLVLTGCDIQRTPEGIASSEQLRRDGVQASRAVMSFNYTLGGGTVFADDVGNKYKGVAECQPREIALNIQELVNAKSNLDLAFSTLTNDLGAAIIRRERELHTKTE